MAALLRKPPPCRPQPQRGVGAACFHGCHDGHCDATGYATQSRRTAAFRTLRSSNSLSDVRCAASLIVPIRSPWLCWARAAAAAPFLRGPAVLFCRPAMHQPGWCLDSDPRVSGPSAAAQQAAWGASLGLPGYAGLPSSLLSQPTGLATRQMVVPKALSGASADALSDVFLLESAHTAQRCVLGCGRGGRRPGSRPCRWRKGPNRRSWRE